MIMQVSNISIKSMLNEIYLDYVNNYLTTDKYAEHQGLNKNDLLFLIDLGRQVNTKIYSKND